jgi:hypothetical protein
MPLPVQRRARRWETTGLAARSGDGISGIVPSSGG